MPRLCFRHQETGRLIAEIGADRVSFIPSVEDRIYAPSVATPGVYAQFRVAGRDLFFDQQGDLALVNLECADIPASSTSPRWLTDLPAMEARPNPSGGPPAP